MYYGDVRVGVIALRVGIPHDEDPWGWSCGFYPGSHPGECTNGSAATFEQARSDFAEAWRLFLVNRTEVDFKDGARRGTGRRENMRCGMLASGLPPNEWEPRKPCSTFMKCLCGEIFNSHRLEENLTHVSHIRLSAIPNNRDRSLGAS
jgi:hypothetical protein